MILYAYSCVQIHAVSKANRFYVLGISLGEQALRRHQSLKTANGFKAHAKESDQHHQDERDDIVTDALQPEINP